MFEIPRIWAGSQDSFDLLMAAMISATEIVEARAGRDDPFELPPLLDVQDGVGVVSVKGPLVAGSAGFMRLFGITGYSDIQAAVAEAVKDKGVKSILLDVKSGGGMVEGADETSQFVRQASALKPVLTYAGGTMASAAYWVGSAANRILATKTSIVGSLGVVVVAMDRSKQLEKEGITAHVVRSGKWKMLANGVEPITEFALAELKAMVMDLSEMFEERVAANLGTSQKNVHDRMGQGREFLGARAVEVGLVHGIANFQEAFATAKVLGRS